MKGRILVVIAVFLIVGVVAVACNSKKEESFNEEEIMDTYHEDMDNSAVINDNSTIESNSTNSTQVEVNN